MTIVAPQPTGVLDPRTGKPVERNGASPGGNNAPSGLYPCAPGGPNDWVYIMTSRANPEHWTRLLTLMGREDLVGDPRYATPKSRLPHLMEIFGQIEEWTKTKTKFEAMAILNEHDIPCGPILSMKEIAEDASLKATGTLVEVDHPKRGKYLSVGNPIKLSDSPTEVTRSPLLGEHTDEILTKVLGYNAAEVTAIREAGALTPPPKKAAAE